MLNVPSENHGHIVDSSGEEDIVSGSNQYTVCLWEAKRKKVGPYKWAHAELKGFEGFLVEAAQDGRYTPAFPLDLFNGPEHEHDFASLFMGQLYSKKVQDVNSKLVKSWKIMLEPASVKTP